MAFKHIALFTFIAVAAAVELHQHAAYHQQPVLATHLVKQVEHEAPAEYNFEYAVHDEHTGDIKEQQETRHGDNVEGHYSLVEPDGHRRTVHYTADEHNGFNAKVEREYTGHQIPQPVQKVYAATAVHHAAPIVHHAAPIVHHAPAVHHVAPAHYTHH